MKYLVFSFIALCFMTKAVQAQQTVQAQQRDSIGIATNPPLLAPVTNPDSQGFNNISIKIPKLKLKNGMIENPGTRYSLINLEKTHFNDAEVNHAITTLLHYAEDEKLKRVVDYLREYTKGTAQREHALGIVEDKVITDSIRFSNGERLPEYRIPDMEEFENTDLQILLSHIHQDSNYIWLKNISRDSVKLEIYSLKDENSKCFWINNGRMNYHRFWAANKVGDTIGTWIQVLPEGNRMRIFVDEDVYQASPVDIKDITKEHILASELPKTDVKEIELERLRRRYWTYYSEVDLNMSQGALVNWASGGENSLSLLSNIRYFWNYNRNKTSWENWVTYRFGFMKNGEEDIRKNEDRFELNSKLGQRAFRHWYYTAQFNTLTQLFSSYEYPKDKERKLVSNFMSPGYFTLSLGLDYKPHDNFSLMLSPIAGKWNFVRDTANIDAKRFGVEEGKRSKRNAGAQMSVRWRKNNIFNIIDLYNEMNAFWSYDAKDKDKEDQKLPLNINWKMTLSFKINYFLRTSIYTELFYDQNSSDKIQFKENLNLGVNFRF